MQKTNKYRAAVVGLLGVIAAELGVVDYALMRGLEVEVEQAGRAFEEDGGMVELSGEGEE